MMERYGRQTILPGVGKSGQQKLLSSKVLVVGVGGLGCAVLPYLTAAGIGTLGIVDGDKVELSNLHRQVLFSDQSVGEYKVLEAQKALNSQNSATQVNTYPAFLTIENVDNLISAYDLVIDATDNTNVRYTLDEACRLAGKPMIYGSIFRFQGQVSVFNYKGGPSYRSLFPEEEQSLLNCAEAGVLGTTVGMIGMLQSNEALKIILGIGEVLSGKILVYNMLKNDQQIFELGDPKGQTAQRATEKVVIISPEEALQDGTLLLDVRELGEKPVVSIEHCFQIPLSVLEDSLGEIAKEERIAIFCQSGSRAISAAKILKKAGFHQVNAIHGGAPQILEIEKKVKTHEKSIS